MTLDELIPQMTNPQEFTRLCNSIFTDIYGDAFQVIDGTRGDNGNDGYVASEHRMLAMYCPIKPEQKTDAGYLEKIRSDLGKVAALKREGRYEIDAWTFVTPRKLADDVIAAMRQLGAQFGIRATHQESTFLANQLYRRSHLQKGFPSLQIVDLGAKIDELARALAGERAPPSPQQVPMESNAAPKAPRAALDEAGEARLHQLMAGTPTQEGKSELKAIAYRTSDPIVEINAILLLFRWFDPSDDDRGELRGFAIRGVDRARASGRPDAEAMFRAHTAAMIVWDFTTSCMEAYFTAMADIAIPIATTPVEQTQQRLTRLRRLEEGWKAEVAAALDLIRKSRDHEVVAGVLLTIGTSMGQLALTYKSINEGANADRYMNQCRILLMNAKDAYAAAGDELGAANAVFNVANQVRFHGGTREAIHLVRSTIPIAEKHGDTLLVRKAKWLLHTLETGKIPDYLAGERRSWSDTPPPPEH